MGGGKNFMGGGKNSWVRVVFPEGAKKFVEPKVLKSKRIAWFSALAVRITPAH